MPQVSPTKYVVHAGWNDVPHLTEQMKKDLLAATPPYLRDARSKGIPSLGAGAIYPVPWEDVTVEPFQIPHYWKRAYAMDVGWNRTAAVWGAKNPDNNVTYLYAEHYVGQSLPVIHATAIKARGEWMQGAIDPAARGRNQASGEQLMATYEDLGLNLTKANNAVEPGLYEVWSDLQFGLLKFFTTLTRCQSEYQLYRRDENGKVVKKNDHLMDCVRYLRMTWDQVATVKPIPEHLRKKEASGVGDRKAGY